MTTIKRLHLHIVFALLVAFISANSYSIELEKAHAKLDREPRFGIVAAFGAEADILLAEATQKHTYKINGNIFTTGNLRGNKVVIVLTGVSIVNATMITQLLVDNFSIHHLLLTGIAGGVNPANNIGDVIVPESWALPMEVYWNGDSNVPAPCGTPGDLSCLGLKISSFTSSANTDYRQPSASNGSGLFMRESFVLNNANAPSGEYKFDFKVDPEMLAVVKTIRPQLDRCGPKNSSLCVDSTPKLRIGGRGISAPVFLANPAYRTYIYNAIQAESVDMETAAFAHVAFANQIPFIAFRSLSDLAGGSESSQVGAFFGSGLAESNESKVTLGFLEAWAKPKAKR